MMREVVLVASLLALKRFSKSSSTQSIGGSWYSYVQRPVGGSMRAYSMDLRTLRTGRGISSNDTITAFFEKL